MKPKSTENSAAAHSSILQNAGCSKSFTFLSPMFQLLCSRCGPYCMKMLPLSFGGALLSTKNTNSHMRMASSKDDSEKMMPKRFVEARSIWKELTGGFSPNLEY